MGNKSEMLGWINFQEERIYEAISTRKNLLIALRILTEELWHKETSLVFNPLKNKWKSSWLESRVPRLSGDSWPHWSQCFEYYALKVAGVPPDTSVDLSEIKPHLYFYDSGSYPAVNTVFKPVSLMVAVLRTLRNTHNHTVCRNIEFWIIEPGCTQSGN